MDFITFGVTVSVAQLRGLFLEDKVVDGGPPPPPPSPWRARARMAHCWGTERVQKYPLMRLALPLFPYRV